jgi:hypothetical protein
VVVANVGGFCRPRPHCNRKARGRREKRSGGGPRIKKDRKKKKKKKGGLKERKGEEGILQAKLWIGGQL